MDSLAQRIERSDFAEGNQFRFLQFGNPPHEIVDVRKDRTSPLSNEGLRARLSQTANVAKPDAKARDVFAGLVLSIFDCAEPFRLQGIDGFYAQTVQLGILHNRGSAVEAHRLIVERCHRERRQVMTLQVRDDVDRAECSVSQLKLKADEAATNES